MPSNGNDTKKDLPQKEQIPQSNTVIFNFYLHLQTPTNQAFTQIELYLICQRYKIKSKSQRRSEGWELCYGCIWYVKDTKLKANHNLDYVGIPPGYVVFDMSKIQN